MRVHFDTLNWDAFWQGKMQAACTERPAAMNAYLLPVSPPSRDDTISLMRILQERFPDTDFAANNYGGHWSIHARTKASHKAPSAKRMRLITAVALNPSESPAPIPPPPTYFDSVPVSPAKSLSHDSNDLLLADWTINGETKLPEFITTPFGSRAKCLQFHCAVDIYYRVQDRKLVITEVRLSRSANQHVFVATRMGEALTPTPAFLEYLEQNVLYNAVWCSITEDSNLERVLWGKYRATQQ